MAWSKDSAEENGCKMFLFFTFSVPISDMFVDPMWTMTHSFYVVMGGFALYDGKENINRPIHPDDFPTHVEQRFTFPTITEEEIKDKSKGDGLAKTIAVIQLLWFSVQLIGRLIKGWAATELEVLTFATSIMTVVIYFFWWNKPLDVHCQTILDPIQLQAVADDAHTDSVIEESEKTRDYRTCQGLLIAFLSCCLSGQEIKSFFTSNPKPQHLFHRKIFELELSLDSFFKVVGFPLVFLWEILSKTDDSTWGPDCANPVSPFILDHTGDAFWETYTPFFTAALFGAMHFITWSFSMPTVGELWLWRSASIALTALPLLSLLCGLVGEPLDDSDRPIARVLADLFVFLGIGCATLHPMIRLVIAIHSVVLLRELPDTAFLVLSWSDSIPSL